MTMIEYGGVFGWGDSAVTAHFTQFGDDNLIHLQLRETRKLFDMRKNNIVGALLRNRGKVISLVFPESSYIKYSCSSPWICFFPVQCHIRWRREQVIDNSPCLHPNTVFSAPWILKPRCPVHQYVFHVHLESRTVISGRHSQQSFVTFSLRITGSDIPWYMGKHWTLQMQQPTTELDNWPD
jgi:hypothetical protein